jgi:hypothetical protein
MNRVMAMSAAIARALHRAITSSSTALRVSGQCIISRANARASRHSPVPPLRDLRLRRQVTHERRLAEPDALDDGRDPCRQLLLAGARISREPARICRACQHTRHDRNERGDHGSASNGRRVNFIGHGLHPKIMLRAYTTSTTAVAKGSLYDSGVARV